MSLRRRAIALLMVLAAATIVAGGVGVNALQDERDRRDEVEARTAAGNASRGLLVDLVDQETGQRGFVIAGRDEFLRPYRRGRREAAASLTRIRRFAGERPELLRSLAEVDRNYAAWQEAARQEVAARRSGGMEAAARLVASGTGRVRFNDLRGAVDDLQRRIDRSLSEADTEARDAAGRLRTTLLILGVILALTIVSATVLGQRWVLRPLLRLRDDMRSVGAGDLSLRITPTGPPEIASVGRDAEAMRRRILNELDFSRGALEALDQQGPVVAALRGQLAASQAEPVPGVSVGGVLSPAEGLLAGDWYDVLALDGDRVAMLVVDVSGHGAEAGLTALRLKEILVTAIRQGLEPERALALAGVTFSDGNQFASCVIVVIDPAAGRVRWANAGHPPPLVVRPGRDIWPLGSTGPILSIMGGEWTAQEADIEHGATVVGYTDGVTEARRGDDFFGDERLREHLQRLAGEGPQAIVDGLASDARDHAGGRPRDDVTLVALRRD